MNKLLMLNPAYRQRERIAQYLIELKGQNKMILAAMLFARSDCKDKTTDFLYEDQLCRFFLPYACYDAIQSIIITTNSFYEIDLLQKVRSYLKEGMVYVDIGANIGNHTVFFSKICKAKQIYSFEPQKEIFRILQKNTELNHCEGVTLSNFALGCKKGMLSINNFDPENWGGTSFIPDDNGNTPVETFDSLNIGKVDFIKIDVEGAETDVLLGAEKTISRDNPIVWCEALDSKSLKRLIQFFKKHRYVYRKISDTNFLFIPADIESDHV
ncbi:MAG: FkbM family methyltransferase [Lentisphaeria bacterium]|nr:FkbM family methyltransferase [Lentisphaeria bacterium]